jgi:hypothetical protein
VYCMSVAYSQNPKLGSLISRRVFSTQGSH